MSIFSPGLGAGLWQSASLEVGFAGLRLSNESAVVAVSPRDLLCSALSRIEGINLVTPFVVVPWRVTAHTDRFGPLIHVGAVEFTTTCTGLSLYQLMLLN